MKRGIGARLEASFRPSVHWGAEFLADKVRLIGLREELTESGTSSVVAASFEGPYADAEAFARARGLAHEGLHGAVSHLPFKLEALESQADDDLAPQAERLKPAGLAVEALDLQGFSLGEGRGLLLAREEAVRAFVTQLPASLSALWSLAPSPLALLPFARPRDGRAAALIVEEGYTHVTFLRDGRLEAYAKVFAGLEEARRDAAGFAREMKKALVYHHGTKFPGAVLESVSLWADGPAGEAASALAGFPVPVIPAVWEPALADVPTAFRAAAAAALVGLRAEEPPATFAVSAPVLPQARRLWMRRAGLLARSGWQVLAVAAAAAVLLVAGALIFRAVVESKAKTWSGELRKWDEFQARRAVVEGQLGSLQGLLSRRTEGYASLQRIAAQLPPEVWLSEWEAEAAGDGARYVHRLTGYSLSESRVPQFLARLEDGKRFASVKLKSTERIPGEKVEKETGIQANRKDLVRFQAVVAE